MSSWQTGWALLHPEFGVSFVWIQTGVKGGGAQCVELKLRWRFCVHGSPAVYAVKYTYNQSFESFLVSLTPDLDQDVLRSIFETLLKKLSLEIIFSYFCQRQFLQQCFRYASDKVLVGIWCLNYQKLVKTLIISRFQGIYCRAHKTATLTPIQHTVGGMGTLC